MAEQRLCTGNSQQEMAMSRLALALFVGMSLLTARPLVMIAQERSYDENALRLEEDFGTKVIRGSSGTVVGKLGLFRGIDLASVVRETPEAVTQAKLFQHEYTRGTLLASVGIATLGAALGAWRINGINSWIPTGLNASALFLIVAGGSRLRVAYPALSKAIWLYNRDLKR